MKFDTADKFLMIYIPISTIILFFLGMYFGVPWASVGPHRVYVDCQIPIVTILFLVVSLIGIISFLLLKKKGKEYKMEKKQIIKISLTSISIIWIVYFLYWFIFPFLHGSGYIGCDFSECPERYAEGITFAVTISVLIIIMWCIYLFYYSRKKKNEQSLQFQKYDQNK